MRYRHFRISMAQPERIREKFWEFCEGNTQNPNGDCKTQIPETRLQSGESKVSRFSSRTSKTGQKRIRKTVHVIIEQFIYAKMPPHLRKSINQAHLENGTFKQIVTHLETELELNGLEAPGELQKVL